MNAVTTPSFRALDGSELLTVLLKQITTAMEAALTKHGNTFTQAKSFPVASVQCALRIGLHHDPHPMFAEPYKVLSIPVKFYSVATPDETIKGTQLLATEDILFQFDVGRSIDSSPDKLREDADLQVLQPQKVVDPAGNERIEDMPAERPPIRLKMADGTVKEVKAK